jgi:hypothetical protein
VFNDSTTPAHYDTQFSSTVACQPVRYPSTRFKHWFRAQSITKCSKKDENSIARPNST